MTDIPDEAVQAATRAFLGTPPLMDGWEPAIRAALEAALPHIARHMTNTLTPLLNIGRMDGGYDCCGCSTYDAIVRDAARVMVGKEPLGGNCD